MHIAVFVQDFLPEVGAGPARISEMASHWIAKGAQVSIVTGVPSRRLPGQLDGTIPAQYRRRLFIREAQNGLDVYRSWLYASPRRSFIRTTLNNATFAITSAAHASRASLRPDVVVASGPPFFSLLSATAWATRKKIPLVLDIRDLWPDYLADMRALPQPALRALFASERWMLRHADAVNVVTNGFRERIIAKGVPPDRIAVFSNGVDLDFYHPQPEKTSTEDTLELGYLGTFGEGQGLESLVTAVRTLRAAGMPVRLTLTGEGSRRDLIIGAAGGDPGIIINSPIPRAETPAFYGAFDATAVPHAALPSLGDTVPSKLFEIMGCARPVIAALAGEGARIVTDSGSGVVAKPGDPNSIAEAIRDFHAIPASRRAEMGRAGRKFVEANYDRRVIAERLLHQLTRIAAR